MTTSSYQASACSKRATQFETQNVPMRCRFLKGTLLCAIVMALSIVPLSRADGGQNGVAVIGRTPTSTPYGCTTTGTSGNIQQAISDAINHTNGITQSVVDASNCTTLNITTEIYVGSATEDPTNPIYRIKFILPANGTWTATFSNSSQYALMWGNGTMIVGGTGSGLGQPFTITSASGTTLKAICGNDPSNTAGYYHVEGFTCSVGAGSTVTDAVLAIGPTFDEAYVGHVNANTGQSPNPPYMGSAPRVLWVHGACCSATFEDINASGPGRYVSGTSVPCNFGSTLADTNAGIHVSKLSCNYPASGSVAVLIQQNGQVTFPATTVANSFKDIYIEEDPLISDNSTPAIDVEGKANNPAPADLLEGFRLGPDTNASVRCALAINSAASRVNVSNLSLRNSSNSNPICAIFDATGASPVYIYGTPKSVITSYDMGPRYLGAMTVGSLPAANQFIGAMFRVTDSTPINSEGQTCAPGGTANALAFSNGSVWKCF